MGLGTHGGGVGTSKFLAKAGAKVIATDLKNAEELKESVEALRGLPIKFVLGQHRIEDFSSVDMVIKNPAVPSNSRYLAIAKEHKIPIETDIGIFFELCPAPILGVTGTRGKSTTASLIFNIIKSYRNNVFLAGNIRISALEKLPRVKKDSLVILELSSWQLEELRTHQKSPRIAVVTNIFRDHMNRYQSMGEYVEAKKNIFRFQKKNDSLILNYDDLKVRGMARETKGVIYFYGKNKAADLSEHYRQGAWLKDDKIVFGEEAEEILSKSNIKLKGEHNVYNILAAVTVAKVNSISAKNIKDAVVNFSGLEGRLQLIKEVNGVEYINDTTSTTPEAAIAALKSFPDKKIILITGGTDKNLEYREMAAFLINHPNLKKTIFLPGNATDKLIQELKALSQETNQSTSHAESMKQAVEEARDIAQEGDIVLLSPAAASFGLFKNEFDRGEKFNLYVNQL